MKLKMIDLIPEIDEVKNEETRQRVITVWEEAIRLGGWTDPLKIPFNPTIGPIPSLIDHTRSVTRTALFFADGYENRFQKGIDRDLLAAGAILHDVSKAMESEPTPDGAVKSEIGKTVPHGFFGGYLAWKAGVPTELIHLITTHTHAVAMLPQRIEGVILRYADLLDADCHYFGSGLPTLMERH